jgi:methionyl-tRNA formyltransferase
MRAVTHPFPGAFTFFRGRKLFIWQGRALAAPPSPNPPAGRVLAGVPGEGLLVATGEGNFLIQQAQWEVEPEFLGPVVATWHYLVGERLG